MSADLENGFAEDPDGVVATIADAAAVGLAGCSIEDFTGGPAGTIYDRGPAVERVAAAAAAAHAEAGIVLTARAENFVRGNPDLADTIARLEAYQEAGADVLYAPGLTDLEDIRRVIASVDRPVNVLVGPGLPTVPELAQAGVARISVGGAFSHVALPALSRAGRELLEQVTYEFLGLAGEGRDQAAAAFTHNDNREPSDSGSTYDSRIERRKSLVHDDGIQVGAGRPRRSRIHRRPSPARTAQGHGGAQRPVLQACPRGSARVRPRHRR